jgi:hypothetical protein
VARFVIYRNWVFRRRLTAPDAQFAAGAMARPDPVLATVPSFTTETNGHHQ